MVLNVEVDSDRVDRSSVTKVTGHDLDQLVELIGARPVGEVAASVGIGYLVGRQLAGLGGRGKH